MPRCLHRKFQGIYTNFLNKWHQQGYRIQDEHTSSNVFPYSINDHVDTEIKKYDSQFLKNYAEILEDLRFNKDLNSLHIDIQI